MAPPRKHSTDAILDAVRARVLAVGPRSVSVAAIARDSGAPVGTLYQRFGSRDAVVAATWLRALERFQRHALASQAEHQDDPITAGVALARAVIAFATEHPLDAQLLLAIRRRDLLDDDPDDDLHHRLDTMNAPLQEAIRRIARQLHGRTEPRRLDAVLRAIVDLPTAAIRRHEERIPSWLENDVAHDVTAMLRQQFEPTRDPDSYAARHPTADDR